jgi:formaldehyde-activating enzyme involved in methanogenesis
MYLAGEALVGDGAEVSHIDLLIGDKEEQLVKHLPMLWQTRFINIPHYLQL